MLDSQRIVVAMSGGVDSSVAALLLKHAGEEVIGVSMQVWDYRRNGGCASKATCCSPDDFTDARMVAAKIDCPYYVFDFEKHFQKEVIDTFVKTYAKGKTPNPCIDCNSKVKFKELRARAESFGCRAVATGHFARIEEDSSGYHLLRGVDRDKDQSYFLYGLSQAELAKTIFPVGNMSKAEVRELAAQHGLVTANKAESQDICFVSGRVQDFLVRIGGAQPQGNIVNTDGIILGQHEGIHAFTVGQRRGLQISTAGTALYVLEIRAESNEIVVGEKSELETESFFVEQCNWIEPAIIEGLSRQEGERSFEAIAQLRHRHQGVRVRVDLQTDSLAQIYFLSETSTVSPGQAAVLYSLDNERVLGGGRIVAQRRRSPTVGSNCVEVAA